MVKPLRALGFLLLVWLGVRRLLRHLGRGARHPRERRPPEELGADDSSTALFFVAVLVCVAAPIAEELFFRGFCFTALRRWIGVAAGAIATG
jgi:membrane protease YdiL (CAAX protease family)